MRCADDRPGSVPSGFRMLHRIGRWTSRSSARPPTGETAVALAAPPAANCVPRRPDGSQMPGGGWSHRGRGSPADPHTGGRLRVVVHPHTSNARRARVRGLRAGASGFWSRTSSPRKICCRGSGCPPWPVRRTRFWRKAHATPPRSHPDRGRHTQGNTSLGGGTRPRHARETAARARRAVRHGRSTRAGGPARTRPPTTPHPRRGKPSPARRPGAGAAPTTAPLPVRSASSWPLASRTRLSK